MFSDVIHTVWDLNCNFFFFYETSTSHLDLHFFFLVIIVLPAGERPAGKNYHRGQRQHACHVSGSVDALTRQQVSVGRLRDKDPLLLGRLRSQQVHRHET